MIRRSIFVFPSLLAMGISLAAQDEAEFVKQVDAAITKGTEWLRKKQKPGGDWGITYNSGGKPGDIHGHQLGLTGIVVLALLKSGLSPADPAIAKGFQFLYDNLRRQGILMNTYERGTILMAIEAKYEATRPKKPIAKGGKEEKFKEPSYRVSPQDQQIVTRLVQEILESQGEAGGFGYGKGFTPNSYQDMSCTQFAILGLKSAARMGADINPAIIRRLLDWALLAQEADGPKVKRSPDAKPNDRSTYTSYDDKARGWSYVWKPSNPNPEKPRGSMTCAGIGTIIIAKSMLKNQLGIGGTEKTDRAIYDGFAWLVRNWSVDGNPGHYNRQYYYLYGLERVGTLGCYETIGTHRWYREGADVLLKQQKEQGFWNVGDEVEPTDILDTCYALLFLKRGTVPVGDIITPRADPK